jgi:hypothetical protein
MRYKLLFLGTFFLLLAFILPLKAITYKSVDISTLKYEPYPAQPGSYLRLYLNVANTGTEQVDDIIIILKPKYPFYLDKGENATRTIYDLRASDSAIIDYKVRVSLDTVEGENELKLKYSIDGGNSWVEKEVTINIQTQDANLAIKSFESAEVEPGEIADLKIILKNNADSYLRNIKVKLDIGGLSVSPVETTEERSIYQMKSGEEKTLEFKLLVSPDASSGPYKIPVNISYYDSIGNNYLKKNYITLIVSSLPEIDIIVEKSTLLTYGQSGEVTLDVVNKGLSQVKFLTVILENTDDYDILSSSEIYIGDLVSDDYDTTEFKIYVSSQVTQLPLKILLKYRDSNNREYSQEKTVNLRLYTPEELGRYNLVSSDYTIYIIALIVIVILIYLWRRRKKKKRK